MGGEPWKVVSPWRTDIATVLKGTRRRVFREGAYRRLSGRSFDSLAALDAPLSDADLESGDFDQGTASILDIRAVGAKRALGCTAPLSPTAVKKVFGTEKPGVADLTDVRESKIYERLTRGDSYYVVLYTKGKRSHVVFYGYSWD